MTMTLLNFFFCLAYAYVNINPATIWGDCSTFAVHAGTAVSFDGALSTIYTGDVGVSPGTDITGSYNIQTGTLQPNTALAVACASSKGTTFGTLKNLTCVPSHTLAASDLSGLTIKPGVWCSASTLFVLSAATLTLDAAGNSSAVFVFQTGTTLTTSTATSFILVNGAQAKNVYWVIGSSATLAGSSSFVGQLVAGVSISVDTNCSINGRTLAAAAVTFSGADSVVLPLVTLVPTSPGIPTTVPTKAPTKTPTKAPTKYPTKAPTKAPTKTPTKAPTKAPTKYPTKAPTKTPTKAPMKVPTKSPTGAAGVTPTKSPTGVL